MSTESNVAPPPGPPPGHPPGPPIQVPSTSDLMLATNAATLVETLFYGIHFVLFCICIFLFIRNKRRTQWFIIASVFIMFAFSTADISITIRLMAHDIAVILEQGAFAYPYLVERVYPKDPIFVTNNFIAELILLYRCYMIWGRSKYLLVATSFLVLADTVWGYLSMGQCQSLLAPLSTSDWKFVPVYLWSVFAINIIISGITVGRIFWVSQIGRPFLGHRNLRHFHIVMVVLLESSAVYSACLLSFLLIRPRNSPYRLVPMVIGMRMVTIMPTWLIVQVGLLAAGDCERPSSVILDTITRDILDKGRDLRDLSFINVTGILNAWEDEV